jgi:hypothetical protein
MKLRFILGLFFSFLFVSSSPALEVESVSHTKQGLTVKVDMPKFKTEKKRISGSIYHLIAVDGWGKTETVGAPQLPTRGILVGIPSRGTVEGRINPGEDRRGLGLNSLSLPQECGRGKKGRALRKRGVLQG